ncbi:hypothetical protein [Lysobacter gummosus]|uniref:hypothetical protein n=1 Tax=Lysobacter gummosus TaxID=262324 RepID=UPI00362B51D4
MLWGLQPRCFPLSALRLSHPSHSRAQTRLSGTSLSAPPPGGPENDRPVTIRAGGIGVIH